MQRRLYSDEHRAFGAAFDTFLDQHVQSSYATWEEHGGVPRDLWPKLGAFGALGLQVPTEYGGGGESSFRWNAMLTERLAARGFSLGGIRAHTDIALPYFIRHTDADQARRWLPGLASGELLAAIAITEPDAGSDVTGLRTTAVRIDDDFVVKGSKTFITNGVDADLILLVVRTSGDRGDRSGLTILALEGNPVGLDRQPQTGKLGLHAQSTATLLMHNVRIPAANVIGGVGDAYRILIEQLPTERLSLAVSAQAAAARVLALTINYVNSRDAFGVPISSFQNTRFVLATCATEISAGQALVDASVEAHDEGTLTDADAAKAKLFCTEMQGRTVDACLQLHGGYGYMTEYDVARAYVDARITRIYGGSSEILRGIIGKSLGLHSSGHSRDRKPLGPVAVPGASS